VDGKDVGGIPNYNSNSKDRALCVVDGSTVLACFPFLERDLVRGQCVLLCSRPPARPSTLATNPCFHFLSTALPPLLIVLYPAPFDADAITDTSSDTVANNVNLSVYC
jgi:hypothetical protein